MNSFDELNHVYRSYAGRLPGATDIIKHQGLIATEWMSEEARWRGKVVHHGIKLINKDTIDYETVDDEIKGYLASYTQFLSVSGFTILGYEQPLFDSAFGCMPDLWGILNGSKTVIELKTGAVPKWAAIQTALQARALKTELGFVAAKRYGLRLMRDGSLSKLVLFDDRNDDYAAMSMLSAFHWKVDQGYIPNWRLHGE